MSGDVELEKFLSFIRGDTLRKKNKGIWSDGRGMGREQSNSSVV
jgi:hypothetical protein